MNIDAMISVLQAHRDGETVEYHVYGSKNWMKADAPQWDFKTREYRVKPKLKKIDMTICIESGVDCEFSTDDSGLYWINKLIHIDSQGRFHSGNGINIHDECRVRQDHWFYSPDGFSQCPVPEGLHLYISTGYSREPMHHYMHLDWSQMKAFKVLGVTEGWEY